MTQTPIYDELIVWRQAAGIPPQPVSDWHAADTAQPDTQAIDLADMAELVADMGVSA